MLTHSLTQSQLITRQITFPRTHGRDALNDLVPGLAYKTRHDLPAPTLTFIALAIFNVAPGVINQDWRWLEKWKLGMRLATVERWSLEYEGLRDVVFYPAQARETVLPGALWELFATQRRDMDRQQLARVLAHVDIDSTGTVKLTDAEIQAARREGRPVDTGALEERLALYRRGYEDALTLVALALGIEPGTWAMGSSEPRLVPDAWEV